MQQRPMRSLQRNCTSNTVSEMLSLSEQPGLTNCSVTQLKDVPTRAQDRNTETVTHVHRIYMRAFKVYHSTAGSPAQVTYISHR